MRFMTSQSAFVTLLVTWSAIAQAQTLGPDTKTLAQSKEKAIAFLKTSQNAAGYWSSPDVPGISALVAYSMMINDVPTSDPTIEKAIKQVLSHTQPDGGIYSRRGQNGNYETALCVMMLTHANKDGQYKEAISKAEKYLRQLQWGDSGSLEPSDLKYGGAGYGSNGERPDLSNTYYFLEALEAAGAKKDDPPCRRPCCSCRGVRTWRPSTTPPSSPHW